MIFKPTPPRLLESETVNVVPYWIEKDGTYWAEVNATLSKSTDKGDTWQTVAPSPNTDPAQRIIVGDTGRVVWVTTRKIFLLNEDNTTWTEKGGNNETGFAPQFGFNKYKNIILLSTYANNSGEVFASFDHGVNWSKIYNGYGTKPDATANYHLHEVSYDPWAGRIIVCGGDNGNRNTVYSDDRGTTWKEAFSRGYKYDNQPTLIIPTKKGILFGSDGFTPRYFSYWKRPQSPTQAPINERSIVLEHWKASETLQDTGHPRTLWHEWLVNVTEEEPVYFMSINPESTSSVTKICISDGVDIQEIWRINESQATLRLFYDKSIETLYFETATQKYKFKLNISKE